MDEILANQLKDALAVILLDPFVSKVLFRLDPMAFRQAQNALLASGIEVDVPQDSVNDGTLRYRL